MEKIRYKNNYRAKIDGTKFVSHKWADTGMKNLWNTLTLMMSTRNEKRQLNKFCMISEIRNLFKRKRTYLTLLKVVRNRLFHTFDFTIDEQVFVVKQDVFS